jgi:glycerol-3-phosphate dehydrogenase
MAQNIEDVLARRTGIQVHSWKNAVAAAPLVGKLLGRELGWSKEATCKAIGNYVGVVQSWAHRAAVPLDIRTPITAN